LVLIWRTTGSSLDVAEAPKLVEDPLLLSVGSRPEGGGPQTVEALTRAVAHCESVELIR
jgi:hypothetical protein